MKMLIELNAILFSCACAILYFVLRYRVHLHIEYTPCGHKCKRHRRRQTFPSASERRPVNPFWELQRDLESALKNLGANKEEARQRAAQALAQGPGDFDALILRAMQTR